MKKVAFESRQRLLKMWSVRIQGVWAVLCGVFVAMPEAQQIALAGLAGIKDAGGLAALTFFAQTSIAISAATIAARAAKQPALEQ